MSHFRSGDGNIEDDPEISHHSGKHGRYQKLWGLGQKYSEVNIKSLPFAKSEAS